MISRCRQRLPDSGIEFVESNLFAWSPDRSYDFAFWLSRVPSARFEGLLVDRQSRPAARRPRLLRRFPALRDLHRLRPPASTRGSGDSHSQAQRWPRVPHLTRSSTNPRSSRSACRSSGSRSPCIRPRGISPTRRPVSLSKFNNKPTGRIALLPPEPMGSGIHAENCRVAFSPPAGKSPMASTLRNPSSSLTYPSPSA